MTGSVDVPMFVVSRLIMGFAIGILVTLVPLYQVRLRLHCFYCLVMTASSLKSHPQSLEDLWSDCTVS